MTKWVYGFAPGKAEGRAGMRDLLGGKGANLAEMANLGLPVPPGFTITTQVCAAYYADAKRYPRELRGQVDRALATIERAAGARFGDAENPLLVSVRSGARASMPGMMDTVLNLGLNDRTVEGLARRSGDARFAWDSYRRFLTMFGSVVLGVEHHHYEEILDIHKDERGIHKDTELTADDWKTVATAFKAMTEKKLGRPFPQDPSEQLWAAIGAVFGSWMGHRATVYRRLHGIPESWGTAVNVQAMVFGNMGEDCATGVAFTRNPSTGENRLYGEYLVNAQGEDVVAGIRTPQHLTKRAREEAGATLPAMEETLPEVFAQLVAVTQRLERHYRDLQDIEFTVQQGRLYMLQTRSGKRTARAALRCAVEMVKEKLIDRAEAVRRIDAGALDQLLHPTLDPKAKKDVVAKGLPASPGAASGAAVFTADEAEALAEQGKAVILVRAETSPEDIHGMHAARGILTSRGGMTSHAAVVARGMGRPCVTGAGTLRVDALRKQMSIGHRVVPQGSVITIDGATGEVMMGEVATVEPELSGDFATLMGWADGFRRIGVRANAETPLDARVARQFAAEGIGLSRTEHMFFDAERIVAVREMILAEEPEGRRAALAKLLPHQRRDFVELFRIMAGLPVTIRLLDPPLHEFLPHTDADIAEVARASGVDPERLRARAQALEEFNPMLGHRGCRLAVTYPEIYEMQARAIFEAAVEVGRELGKTVIPEVMIPLVVGRQEFDQMKALVDKTAAAVRAESGAKVTYSTGTMIELPRACLMAGEIAAGAEFFSFGTNDLTQTAYGLSRDDSSRFLPDYIEQGIFEVDPFVSVDRAGVGELMRIATQRGRAVRPRLKLGICGEHGGDPASVAFCHQLGLDYVSCSPYRVPIARLAAAQAALADRAATKPKSRRAKSKRKAKPKTRRRR
ncbi:MAG: pyruvate, phosphate dikinase [Alphaproteobacteria bacterium]|nr:pyruvate, phosphate dikinase [Alphaproteobacteria bacterium]